MVLEEGNHTPHTLLQIQYICSMAVAKRKESGHGNVRQGFGAETQVTEGGGGAGEYGGGLPGLWETYGDGDGI